MAKKLMPCNLTKEERNKAWEEFDGWLTPEEEAEVMDAMGNYLFYQPDKKGKARDCVCTRPGCGRFRITRKEAPGFWSSKHGSIDRCPRCGLPEKVLALGKMRSFATINDRKQSRITVCRTGENGALLLLSAYVHRHFSWNDLRGIPEISWKAYTYLAEGKRMQWFNIWMPQEAVCDGYRKWDYTWTENKAVKEPFQPFYYGESGDSFIIGGQSIMQSVLKYSQIEEWLIDRGDSLYAGSPLRHIVQYLSAYTQYPTLEMAVKLGLYHAVNDLVIGGKKNHAAIDWAATTAQGFLRLNKQDTKAYMATGGDLEVLAAYHTARRTGIVSNMPAFLACIKDANAQKQAKELTGCARKAGCTLRQAVNYIKKQSEAANRALITWDDYLNMAKQLQFDMSRSDVTMPKDLQDRHDAAAETLNYRKHMKEQKRNKAFNKRLRKMYEFTYGGLCVKVPGSVEEIVMEGRTLKHCVGGYAARHFNDKVTILFIRHSRKPGTPFITMEIHPRAKMTERVIIRQVHGYRNEGYLSNMGENEKYKHRPAYKYKWFLDIWRTWVESGSKRDKKGNPDINEVKEASA